MPDFDDLKGSPLYDRLTKGTPLALNVDGADCTPRFESMVGKLPPGVRTHVQPEGGWKERTYYVVEVASGKGNPIHRSILFVGFFGRAGRPLGGSYTSLFNASYGGDFVHPETLHYLRVVCEIKEMSRGR
jgi:hypothetical protein